MSSEVIQIDLADKDACTLIEHYILKQFSDPSVKFFEDLQEDINVGDIERMYRAAGKALLNEAINDVLIEQLNREIEEREQTNDE